MFDGHRRHSVVLVFEYVLALHPLQMLAGAEIDVETLPAVHWVHRASPTVSLKFPATHAVHGPPSGPV